MKDDFAQEKKKKKKKKNKKRHSIYVMCSAQVMMIISASILFRLKRFLLLFLLGKTFPPKMFFKVIFSKRNTHSAFVCFQEIVDDVSLFSFNFFYQVLVALLASKHRVAHDAALTLSSFVQSANSDTLDRY